MTKDIKVTAADIALAQATRRWNLTFPEPVESRFDADVGYRRAKMLRLVTVRTIIAYNSFLAGDYFLANDVFGMALVIHFAVVTPWMILAAVLLSRPMPARARNLLIVSVPGAMIAGILTVFSSSTDPLADHYQYFVVIVLIYANAVLRPSYPYALGLSLVTVVAHAATCFFDAVMPTAAAASAAYGLAIAAWVSLVANFNIERDLRRTYLTRLRDSLATRDLQRTAADLQRISHVDALTGLANRRGVDARTAALFAGAGASRNPFAVLMVDVDHFKAFNDRYGHPEGDRCLARAGEALRDAVREGVDIIGRYGGEEFIAILPEGNLQDGINVAERMRALVEALAMPHDHSEAGVVTVSIGIGVGHLGDPDSLTAAIAAADAALYEAKAAGRNCVRPPVGRNVVAHRGTRAA